MINTIALLNSQQTGRVSHVFPVTSQNLKKDIKVKQDEFEKSNTTAIIYETYSKDVVKPDYSLSPFGNRYGYEFQGKICNYIYEYYEGSNSEEQVLDYFESCCQRMIEYYMPKGIQNEQDTQYAGQIVEKMYGEFKRFNTAAAVDQDCAEGEKLNNQYSNSDYYDFAYYSAKHYYQWKHMEEKILDRANEVNQKITGKNIDYHGPHTATYNELWNNWFCTNLRLSGMKDMSIEPPEGFEMFYKQRPYKENTDADIARKGHFMICTSAGKNIMEVPFTYEPRLMGQIFSVKNLLERMGASNQKKYYDFADNFLIFTREYGTFYGVTYNGLRW